ncbi:hypothetical protein [Rhizobium leguminosarum]|jgi:hypothetical protein|uniref:hypothetical protein n=1 Tax=Rhizobium leguminosarum TaxID=384 RepID=UPI002E1057BB|nr:hypothetical protein U8Q02_44060 [Rhizobium leguminosarum]
MILKKSEFFSWCLRHGLKETSDVVAVIPVSGQTVRNWMNKRKDEEELAPWVYFATRYYDEAVGRDADLRGYRESAGGDSKDSSLFVLPPMSVPELKDWQYRHGFGTYKATGDVFGIKRQAVHNWFKRDRFPRWLSIACAGYDLSIQSMTKVGRNKAA